MQSRIIIMPTTEKLEERLYNIFTHREHRCGKKDATRKPAIIQNIRHRLDKELPIHFLQFWGGAKNPNLAISSADLCEERSLDHLFAIHNEVKKIYNPGLAITISTGDGRVKFANDIPKEDVEEYNDSFLKMLSNSKYEGIFNLKPVSVFYSENKSFWSTLKETYKEVNESFDSLPCIDRLLQDGSNNIKGLNLDRREAALRYVSIMVTEERVKLYEEFEDHIRTFFIKFGSDYGAIYKKFLPDLESPFLTSKCGLSFYTGSKGNITQPWQAKAIVEDNKVLFLSQRRLKG